MPVYVEATVFDLPRIYINAGHRGLMLRIDPADLRRALDVTEVNVAV